MEEKKKSEVQDECNCNKKDDVKTDKEQDVEATADKKKDIEADIEADSDDEADEMEDAAKKLDEAKKSLFGKKEKKDKKDKKDEKIEELNDRLIRQMAEFDNFRKRTEKEKSQMFEIGAKDIIEKILPIVDSFERGLAGVSEDDKGDAFVQGMQMVYKQLLTALTGAGVKPIEAVGTEFDPNFHNAVMHIEDEEQGENIVVEEFQKGYMYRDTVVRHSMVKVAN